MSGKIINVEIPVEKVSWYRSPENLYKIEGAGYLFIENGKPVKWRFPNGEEFIFIKDVEDFGSMVAIQTHDFLMAYQYRMFDKETRKQIVWFAHPERNHRYKKFHQFDGAYNHEDPSLIKLNFDGNICTRVFNKKTYKQVIKW